MDSSLRTIALANRSGQIEGPIFAQQKGNKLTLRAGRGQEDRSMPLGRYSDDDTSPPSPGRPSLLHPSAALAALLLPPPRPPYRRQPMRRPPRHPPSSPLLRPFCVSPFRSRRSRQRPRGSVSRLIKRRKLANEISIRLRNTLIGVIRQPPFPVPSFYPFDSSSTILSNG